MHLAPLRPSGKVAGGSMGPVESGNALADSDEAEIVRRPAKALAACLACDICTGLLIEPLTAPECMHCFCRECITAFIVPGRSTHCPVCQGEGATRSFGPQPLRDHLRVDFMLTDLLRKVPIESKDNLDGATSMVIHISLLAARCTHRAWESARTLEKCAVLFRCLASWHQSQ